MVAHLERWFAASCTKQRRHLLPESWLYVRSRARKMHWARSSEVLRSMSHRLQHGSTTHSNDEPGDLFEDNETYMHIPSYGDDQRVIIHHSTSHEESGHDLWAPLSPIIRRKSAIVRLGSSESQIGTLHCRAFDAFMHADIVQREPLEIG